MIECKKEKDGVMIKVAGSGREILFETAAVIEMCYESLRKTGMPEELANSTLTAMVFSAVEEYNTKHDGGDEPNDASE